MNNFYGQNLPPESNERVSVIKLAKILGISRSTVYSIMNPDSKYFDPTFPSGTLLSVRSRRFPLQDCLHWAKTRPSRGPNGGHKA